VKKIFRKLVEVELNSEDMKKYIVKRPGFSIKKAFKLFCNNNEGKIM